MADTSNQGTSAADTASGFRINTTTTTTDQTDRSQQTTDTGDDDDDQSQQDEGKWKALARKHEKESKALAAKVKEFEDKGKSVEERLTSQLTDASSKLTEAETRAMRLEVAIDKGLPKRLALRLQGSDRDEMEADADELLETLGGQGQGDQPRRIADLDGGGRQTGPKTVDMNDEIRKRAGRSS
jgi:hypothetical protein